MKRILTVVSIGLALILLIPAVALAYTWHIDFTVTETGGNAYTSLPLSGLANNSYLAANGYIAATGLNTRVYASDNSVLPHMLSEDKTWFVTPQPALNSQVVTYALGDTAVSSFKVIPGYSGNVTIPDDATLELDRHFDISISGYFLSSSSPILYKSGAVSLTYSVTTLTWHGLNADNTDNWTMTAVMSSGSHTVRVYANGQTAYLLVDGVGADSEALADTSGSVVDATAAASLTLYGTSGHYTYYSDGLNWAWWRRTGDNNVWYSTSAGGLVWAAPTQVTSDGEASSGSYFSLCFDGTYVHYIRRDVGSGAGHMSYRRGDPESDGTITWSAAEQDINSGAVGSCSSFTITVKSTGHAFIAFVQSGLPDAVKVLNNTATDGSWSTGSTTSFSSLGSYVCLTADPDSSNIYLSALGVKPDYDVRGRIYNGTSWSGSDEVISATDMTAIVGNGVWDTNGNYYQIWFWSSTGQPSYICKRSSAGSWGTPANFCTTPGAGFSASLSYDSIANRIYIFYRRESTDDLYYKVYDCNAGTISDEVLMYTGSFGTSITSSYELNSSNTGVVLIDSTNQPVYARLYYEWEWLDNTNNWLFMDGNSMSYADNMTITVQGTQKLLYRPDSIIIGTTLPDESGNGNDGTFSWGTNPADVDVIPGPLASDVDVSEPEEGGAPWKLIPTVPGSPSGLFTDGGEGMLGLAELGDASEATGNPREMFAIMLAFLLSVLIGFAVYGATHNAKMGVKGSVLLQSISSLVVMIFFYVGGGGVIPGWVLIPFGIEAFFIMLWRNPQHSAT